MDTTLISKQNVKCIGSAAVGPSRQVGQKQVITGKRPHDVLARCNCLHFVHLIDILSECVIYLVAVLFYAACMLCRFY
jgi:hypothetical protein